MTKQNETLLPLAGIRVIEFCSIASGPFCGMLLADMGAEVIKVEPPGGDGLRQWPPITDGYSENFASLNRNKQSIALDLKNPEDSGTAAALINSADVVIENNRPGVMSRLGLGYSNFADNRPQLIYCSISAYGQTGPRAAEGGFDLTIQAASGVMSVTGEPDGEPVKCGVPISDFTAGLYAAYSIAASLAQVRAGGDGGHIDIPMFGCTLGIAALQTSEYFGTGKSPRKLGSAHPRNAPYQAFRAKDGFFAIAAGNQKLWSDVCRAVDMPQLCDDSRFATTSLRAQNQAELKAILEERFTARPVEHWITVFHAAGVPHARINDFAAALDDPQTKYMEWIGETALPNGAHIKTFLSPIRINGKGPGVRIPPPALDEHGTTIRAQYRSGETASASQASIQQECSPPPESPCII